LGAGSAANTLGLSRADRANADIENVIRSIPQKPAVGDYFAGINKFNNGAVARWTSFPVLVHLPQGSPSNWQKTLEESVSSWGKFIPVRVASPSEAADIEIAWINHLPPRTFGQTNLEVFNGRMRVTVYLLRPTYYLPNTPERMLHKTAEHEVGHALGIFGHSPDSSDLMYQFDSANAVNSTKDNGISPRDLNTLKHIYESPALPPGFQSPHPMGWSLKKSLGD
jgi:predicted Zn-dependent protease